VSSYVQWIDDEAGTEPFEPGGTTDTTPSTPTTSSETDNTDGTAKEEAPVVLASSGQCGCQSSHAFSNGWGAIGLLMLLSWLGASRQDPSAFGPRPCR